MNNKPQTPASVKLYNQAVKTAYFKLLRDTKRMIARVERHDLRYTLQRADRSTIAPFIIVHEFISPIVYLSLRSIDGERLTILWGIEQFDDECDYSPITSGFLRMLYKLTSAEYTPINIERCINIDSIITQCSLLYECTDSNNHYHKFVLIKERPARKAPVTHLSIAS